MPTVWPPQHGRSHIPTGYSVVVRPTASSTPLTTPRPSDPFPSTVMPSSASVPVEWITLTSTTNWAGGGFTSASFTFTAGNYDSTTPTFDVVAGVPKIYRSGAYEFRITVVNVSQNAPKEAVVRATLTNTAGAIPFIHSYNPDQQLVNTIGNTVPMLVTPWWSGLILYSGSAGSLFGTPSSFDVSCAHYEDGTIVADTGPVVGLSFVRLGDAFS